MKRKLYLLMLILTVTITGFSQNVGFMGKRFIVNAEGVFSTAYTNININGNSGFFSYNWMISPNLEVICHNKGTVGTAFNFFQTKFKSKFMIEDIRVLGAGIFYKQYIGRNSHAPYGIYLKIQFDWLRYEYISEFYSSVRIDENYNLYCLKIAMGKDYLFFNRLRLSWDFSVGIPLYGDEDVSIIAGRSLLQEASNKKARVFCHYLFGFKVGVGLLAF